MFDLLSYKNLPVHFVGAGGSSMSGLIALIKERGFTQITGSDKAESGGLGRVRALGVAVQIGHQPDLIKNARLVVASAAIAADNPELQYAQEAGIPVISRAQMLGAVSRLYERAVCVAGTHGKTTVTSMIAHILFLAGTDPGVHIGGVLPLLGGSVRPGKGDVFVTEACEYVDSYLELTPDCAIVLNIDEDHMDYFKTLERIYQSFTRFVSLTKKNGMIIGCADDPLTNRLLQECGRPFISYGYSEKAKFRLSGFALNKAGQPCFTLAGEGEEVPVCLSVLGKQNTGNAAAALLAARHYGVPLAEGARLLQSFTGANRRMEPRGTRNGAKLYNDYGHHAEEVKATIAAVAPVPKNRLWVVYQPALFSRFKATFPRLATCFAGADRVVLIDIYGAREPNDPALSSAQLCEAVKANGQNCVFIPDMADAARYLEAQLQPGDICLIMGSGTIDKLDSFIKKDAL